MTQHQHYSGEAAYQAAKDHYLAEFGRLWFDTVDILTAAVRLTQPLYGPIDFADFLASTLAAVAGNLGSVERVTAGRPESWESDLLTQLLTGTLGEDVDLVEFGGRRTEPITVRLNVAQLIREARINLPLEEHDQIIPTLDDAITALPAPATENGPTGAEVDRPDTDATEQVRQQYRSTFETYGQRFTAAVTAAAADLTGLAVPVEIQLEVDPHATWWRPGDVANPQEWDEDDEVAWRLWSIARQRTGLPTLTTTDNTDEVEPNPTDPAAADGQEQR